MKTLELWEKEARLEGSPDVQIMMAKVVLEQGRKILALCALVRAKDEAILAMLTRNSIFETEGKLARDALALTEQLGS